jgi:UPF0716 protein FxsA
MLTRLLLLFILFPIVEMAVLIQLGRAMGLWTTIGLVVATGTLGAFLARRQGLRAFREIQYELSRGRVPAGRLLDGFMILVGAILLLTPGVLSDTAGILLLLPPVRGRLAAALRHRFEKMIRGGQVSMITLIRPPTP